MKFDPTINLGHLISAGCMLAAGFGAYGNIDKRLSVLEDKNIAFSKLSDERSDQQKEVLREIKTDVKDLTRAIAITNQGPKK